MQTGDKVKIKRGKHAGAEGEVRLTNTDTAVLEMADGSLITQKISNIVQPVEATITQDELAAIINSLAPLSELQRECVDRLVHNIDSKYPGFARRIDGPPVIDNTDDALVDL